MVLSLEKNLLGKWMLDVCNQPWTTTNYWDKNNTNPIFLLFYFLDGMKRVFVVNSNAVSKFLFMIVDDIYMAGYKESFRKFGVGWSSYKQNTYTTMVQFKLNFFLTLRDRISSEVVLQVFIKSLFLFIHTQIFFLNEIDLNEFCLFFKLS